MALLGLGGENGDAGGTDGVERGWGEPGWGGQRCAVPQDLHCRSKEQRCRAGGGHCLQQDTGQRDLGADGERVGGRGGLQGSRELWCFVPQHRFWWRMGTARHAAVRGTGAGEGGGGEVALLPGLALGMGLSGVVLGTGDFPWIIAALSAPPPPGRPPASPLPRPCKPRLFHSRPIQQLRGGWGAAVRRGGPPWGSAIGTGICYRASIPAGRAGFRGKATKKGVFMGCPLRPTAQAMTKGVLSSHCSRAPLRGFKVSRRFGGCSARRGIVPLSAIPEERHPNPQPPRGSHLQRLPVCSRQPEQAWAGRAGRQE